MLRFYKETYLELIPLFKYTDINGIKERLVISAFNGTPFRDITVLRTDIKVGVCINKGQDFYYDIEEPLLYC